MPEDSGNLSYSPCVIRTDSSTEITSLVLSVSNVKLCWTERHFKVHFFATSQNLLIFGSP